MNWKHWPYWVKGGIIGGILSVLVFVFKIFVFPDCTGTCSSFGTNFLSLLKMNTVQLLTQIIVSFFAVGFIVGAIVGLIYSKIKNRKQIIN